MRFMMNENIPGTVIRILRERKHDVLAAKESMRGASDEEVLARARLEGRLVVMQDKDFGELAFRARLPATCGIILFRLEGGSSERSNRRMLDVLESGTGWAGSFAVAGETQVRIRPLPSQKGTNP